MSNRCPRGTRKNKSGECVQKNTVIIVKSVDSVKKSTPMKSTKNRCPRGTQKNKEGVCVQKNGLEVLKISEKNPSPEKTKTSKKRCPKGMRKDKQGNCSDTKPTVFAKIPDEPVKLLPSSNIKLDTIEEQCDYYNSSQDNFIFKNVDNIIRITNKRDGTNCGKIIIKEKDYIYIDLIGKCGSASGTAVIKAIEDFAHKCKYRKLGLEDDSRIGTRTIKPEGGFCEFFLSGISILSTGETWYNKLGYKSEWYDKEVAHNKRIIAKPFLAFMNNDIRTIARNLGWDSKYFARFDNMMKDCTMIVKQSELEKISVKDFFTILQNKLRNKPIDCKDKESLLCSRLEHVISNNGGFVTNGWETRKMNNIVIHRMNSKREPIIQYKYL